MFTLSLVPLSVLCCIIVKVFFLLEATEIMTSTEPTYPDSLKGFGYAFNKDGQLRKIDPVTGEPGNEPFEFKISNDQSECQRHYEAFGEVITQHIYYILENELKLHKLPVPKTGNEPKSFIFATPDALHNPEKLLILIHGSGAVKAGQWARRLIINDSLQTGSQIPYIKKAVDLGYAVMVLNTNDNTRMVDGKRVQIKGSRDPKEHVNYVWKHYVLPSKAQHVAIVAHSYGGVVTVDLASNHFSEFRDRVFAIALTDSVHSFSAQKTPTRVAQYLLKVSRNWVSESEPLDAPISTPEGCIEKVSAGDVVHEYTSWSSIDSVFKFLERKYSEQKGKEDL